MLGDDAILAVLHLGIVQARILADDSLLVRMHETLPHVCRLEQRLGRNASYQQAGAAESGLLLDESGFQAVLAGADGTYQQAGAAESGLLLDESGFQAVLAGADGCGVAAG